MAEKKTWEIIAEPNVVIDIDEPVKIFLNSQFTLVDCSDCSNCSDSCFCGWGG